ncbi:hypothetical protein HanIR_Chr03g0143851 [Helianthus annuus]|nr:hypothetical protein HanIR_Chr03g0143851 [Helianthus annuus]
MNKLVWLRTLFSNYSLPKERHSIGLLDIGLVGDQTSFLHLLSGMPKRLRGYIIDSPQAQAKLKMIGLLFFLVDRRRMFVNSLPLSQFSLSHFLLRVCFA